MEFKKKMIIRLIIAIGFITFGAELIIINLTGLATNKMISSLGLGIAVIGIARVIQYFRITKDEESMHKREVEETDERNVMIWTQARSLSFTVYILLAAAAIIVLYLLNMEFAAQIVSYAVCAFVLVYWFCYFIISRKY